MRTVVEDVLERPQVLRGGAGGDDQAAAPGEAKRAMFTESGVNSIGFERTSALRRSSLTPGDAPGQLACPDTGCARSNRTAICMRRRLSAASARRQATALAGFSTCGRR